MEVFQVVFRSTLDLIAGTLAGSVSEYIFSTSWDKVFQTKKDNAPEIDIVKEKTARVFLQAVFTAITSYEVRNLYTSESTVDPTGGLMFIIAIANMLPDFFVRVREVLNIWKAKLTKSIEKSNNE